jgi:hypothetical protein
MIVLNSMSLLMFLKEVASLVEEMVKEVISSFSSKVDSDLPNSKNSASHVR